MYTQPQKKRRQNKTTLSPNNQYITYIAKTQPNQPYRHSVQVSRLSPGQNKLQCGQRLTHRPQIYYHPVQQIQQRREHHVQQKLDTSLPSNKKQYPAIKKIRNQRVFETKGPTPRMTAARAIQTQFEDDEEEEYIVIPTRTKKHHYVTNYSDEQIQDPQQYEDLKRIEKVSILSKQSSQPIKVSKQTMIPIMVPTSKNKTIQYIKNEPVMVQRKKKIIRIPVQETVEVEQRNIRNSNGKNHRLNTINHVQNQRHSHKRRSEHGPMPTLPNEVRRHRRLATTAQLNDEQYSKTQTQDQVQQQIDRYQPRHHDQQQQQQQYQYEQVEVQEEEDYGYDYEDEGIEGYEDDQYVIQQYQQYPAQGQPNFYKTKKTTSQNTLQKQIKARFKDIENIMQTQNQNLKDHNQYLLAVIKKMQSKDRKQRALIVSQNESIKQLTEERNAYMERCMHYQGLVEQNSEKVLNKHCSVLTLDLPPELANQQNSTASDANNQTVNFARRQIEERQRKLGGLRRHLKNTINQVNIHSAQNHYKKPVGSHMLQHQTQHNESNNHIVHSPTPKFQSKKDSPQRKPRLTTKISNSSQGSDPSSTIFNNNNSSQIMNNSNSFGAGFINSNSGFNVIKTLSHNLNDMQIDDDTEQIYEQPRSFEQQSEEHVNPDDLITAKNSGSDHKIKYATNTDEQDIEQLNKKFEELMKLYRTNHDVAIRKQCVQIAKKIKEIKNQVQQNKETYSGRRVSRLESKNVESDMTGQLTRVKSGHKRSPNMSDLPISKVQFN